MSVLDGLLELEIIYTENYMTTLITFMLILAYKLALNLELMHIIVLNEFHL